MQLTEIRTDDTLRELQDHGTPEFPFAFYDETVQQFRKGYIDWHWHSELEWVLVAQGTLDCRVAADTAVRLQAGDGLFCNARVLHRLESPQGAHIPNLLFLPELLAPRQSAVYQAYVAPVLASGRGLAVLRAADPADAPVLAALQAALDAARGGDALDIQLAVLALWRAFVRAQGAAFAAAPAGRDALAQARVMAMMQYITAHFAQKVTLAGIAAAAGISKSEALRCFHKTLQTTPVQFLLHYRLGRARDRLLHTDDTVTVIAIACGFENISYFVRQFAAHFGMTPKAYRQANRA